MTKSRVGDEMESRNPSSEKFLLILPLFFFSGVITLIYEVLWMKQLGLLFGNTAIAAATVLTAFFSGLAAGGYFWGQRAAALHNPLQTYGILEVSSALCVLGSFQIMDGYFALYPSIFEIFGNNRWGFVAVKFFLSIVLLFPASFFIGGTLPVATQYLVRDPLWLGQRISVLYGINTLGAATGSLLAGCYLPPIFGFTGSYRIAMAGSVALGGLALIAAKRWPHSQERWPSSGRQTGAATSDEVPEISLTAIHAFAFISGFGTLCLEVLWTRMYAQVLQNSVYTFATILFVFLLAMSAGAALANRLMKLDIQPVAVLNWLFILGGLFVALTPFLFNGLTDRLTYVGTGEGWRAYLIHVLALEVAVMVVPVLILGAIFPFLLKIAEPYDGSPGRLVGRLVALNTMGSIVGSLAAGFLILDTLGLWAGIRLVAVIYLLVALQFAAIEKTRVRTTAGVAMIVILTTVSVLDTTRLPQVKADPLTEEESLLQVWESGNGTVAVIRRKGALKIKVNNYYTLGGSGSKELEEFEGYLPVVLHGKAESAFFLGLGTGISAGAMLHSPIRRLVVAELIPEVVRASNEYFGPFNNRLFFDSRVEVIEEDGRNFLAGSPERFDLIVADLFIPWRSGAGSLYALEHYRTVRERLQENGLFMQWLPGYQLSETEFGSIVRTMLEVFPQVTLWRGDFSSMKPVLGLLAESKASPLADDARLFPDPHGPNYNEGLPILAYYVGNLGESKKKWQAYPVNSDDKPVIEYLAPITQRREKTRKIDWLTRETLLRLMGQIQETQAPESDPYLKNLSPELRSLPKAGMALHRSRVLRLQGRLAAAKVEQARYHELVQVALAELRKKPYRSTGP